MYKTGESVSGIFTIKEYMFEEEPDFLLLLKQLMDGPGEVREVVSYVFEGEDPLGLDARSFSPEEFRDLYPQMKSYGPGLAFDIVVGTEGHPLTVELTQGERVITTNSLDKELDLDDLLSVPVQAMQAGKEADDTETEGMTPRQLLEILGTAEKLKCVTRHCDTSSGRRESVAEHSWRAALMAMLLAEQKEYEELDMNRVIRMCLIHDLGEAFTGDIPTFEKTEKDAAREDALFEEWIERLPPVQKREFQTMFAEMQEQKTPEARLYKALDKLEAVIQHNESDLSSWLPLEYDLQLTYGNEEVRDFPYLRALKEEIDAWTRKKIIRGV